MSSNVPPRIGCESASRCDLTLTTRDNAASWIFGSGVGSSMSFVRSSSSSYIALRRLLPGVAVRDLALQHTRSSTKGSVNSCKSSPQNDNDVTYNDDDDDVWYWRKGTMWLPVWWWIEKAKARPLVRLLCFVFSLVLWHWWLADRKDIRPVKTLFH